MTNIEIIYPSQKYFASFHDALAAVAKEEIYLEMVVPPPLENVVAFQNTLIAQNAPVFYATENDRVIGWCDVFPKDNPRQSHRGSLGMGIISSFRGRGIGSRLLSAVIDQSIKFGLEKIELNVYTSNLPAIALYKKYGFEQEGLIKRYRKVKNQYFDCIAMGKLF